MKRRNLLQAVAGASGMGVFPSAVLYAAQQQGYNSPYEDVDWAKWDTLDSMSHQHTDHQLTDQPDSFLDLFLSMRYGHFAFSNYYPSKPIYPLPESWVSEHPEIIAAPNAEHHSFSDVGLHANGLGSLFASGYGKDIPKSSWRISPVTYSIDDLTKWSEERPWDGIYRIDIRSKSTSTAPEGEVKLTIEGAEGCDQKHGYASTGVIVDQVLPAGGRTVYFRVMADVVTFKVEFDPERVYLSNLRIMQGTNRPWRDVFRVILDGETVNGEKRGGLLYPDAGGITLNHPVDTLNTYIEMLDFDPRVLGMEIWNYRRGFGTNGTSKDELLKDRHFYHLWDQILSTGRRCWSFCVKDHRSYDRGRNILLVPPLSGLSPEEKEVTALRAYRQGSFFGSVSSIAIDEGGNAVPPYDYSTFRFQRIKLRRNAAGEAEAIEVEIGGQEKERLRNLQIRFITERGIASIVDAEKAEFALSERPLYVRVEAFAYPDTVQGKPLRAEEFRKMDVVQISELHDRMMRRPGDPEMTPAPIVDMLFSQAIRRI